MCPPVRPETLPMSLPPFLIVHADIQFFSLSTRICFSNDILICSISASMTMSDLEYFRFKCRFPQNLSWKRSVLSYCRPGVLQSLGKPSDESHLSHCQHRSTRKFIPDLAISSFNKWMDIFQKHSQRVMDLKSLYIHHHLLIQ